MWGCSTKSQENPSGKPLQYLIKEFLLAYNMHYISDLYIKTHLMKEQIQTS